MVFGYSNCLLVSTMLRGYDRDELVEDGYDDYEDEECEQEEDGEEEEYEEEEVRKPTKEELEYLELRQRLKEQIRRQRNKEGSFLRNNSNDKKKKLPYDNYGSFFGPSQPVIAQRVIQESKSLLETQHLTARVSNSIHSKKQSSGSSATGLKSGAQQRPTKVVNEFKSKAQKLKDTRDYSFLLSEDTEFPAPAKEPPPRNLPAANSDARSAQVPMRSKQPMGNSVRHGNGGREERKSVSMNGHMHSKVGSNKLASGSKPNSTSVNPRKQLGSNHGNGPGRPLVSKGLPSKMPASFLEKKASAPIVKSSMPVVHKPPSLKAQPSISKQRVEQKREMREPIQSNKAKLLPKQPVGLSKPQINKPQKQVSSHHKYQDNRPKKRPVSRYSDDEGDEDADAFSMLRQIIRYNPGKYADREDDLSDMEANFEDIMKEERRSAKIARKEDEEERLKIEEEERLERLAKLKKRKLR
ncbi:hypothetical protein FNV43_RR17417 [Rhamnella rubrinervis]|uniref:Protein SPT2 homolog n=1 Tax=Rhamnella rubrinervis TaxID=2594499 RepID=A0A8K0DX26_9ROSA|nr:hypothetical protein FNV43_RR17417 [Rhamnella rubrinervis]